jgi:hypothetical protein
MKKETFAVENFKLNVDYLKTQYDRMWTRFNYFLTVQLALFGFFGWIVFERQEPAGARLPGAIGTLVSLIWYVTAAEDRALVAAYRKQVARAAERVSELSLD